MKTYVSTYRWLQTLYDVVMWHSSSVIIKINIYVSKTVISPSVTTTFDRKPVYRTQWRRWTQPIKKTNTCKFHKLVPTGYKRSFYRASKDGSAVLTNIPMPKLSNALLKTERCKWNSRGLDRKIKNGFNLLKSNPSHFKWSSCPNLFQTPALEQ